MYLKNVYLQGFKSFAKKTKIDFNNKITGVVGPNGSGKSNISDAIMWVLGETSVKTLRGQKMEDVIFSGTSQRKPLGFAEVSIVFDNKDRTLNIDADEVSVTRKMYRSLESEFSINNHKCRLKDIKELFMDTGIGKDGYSLIGQGKIESILSNKPEQRRSVFEEAAGISKYKLKKIESENKLKKTEENIIRLNDIIKEIEEREKVLKEESIKAKEYKNIYEKLVDYELTMAYIDIEKQNSNKITFKTKLDENLAKFEELSNLIESLKSKELQINEEIISLESLIEEIQNLEVEKNKEYERDVATINLLDNKIENSKNSIDEKSKEISIINEKIKNNIKFVKELEDELNKSKLFEKVCSDSVSSLKEVLNSRIVEMERIEDIISKENDEILNLHKKEAELQSKIGLLDSLILEKKDRIKNINSSLNLLEENNIEIENNQKKFLNKLENSKLNLENLTSDIKKINIELTETNDKNLKLKKDFEEVKNRLNESTARYNVLKNISENYEGYNKSVKSFMNISKKRNLFENKLIGPVADNLKVDSKYELAISACLGGSTQNIIIEKDSDAKEMISLLMKENLGRVTFLPKNSIRFTSLNIDLSSLKSLGVIDFAYNLVEYSKELENIFKYLLGKIIIVEDFDSALKVQKKLSNSYRIVTLKGDSLNLGGSITGGSISKGTSEIISRKNELENLKIKIFELKEKNNSLVEEINKSDEEIKKLTNSRENLLKEEIKLKEVIVNLNSNIDNLNRSKENNQNYLDNHKNEILNLENSIKVDDEELSNKKKLLENIKNEIENKNLKGTDIEKELQNLKLDIEDSREDYSSKQLELVKLRENIKSSDDRYNTLNLEINLSKNNLEKLTIEIENLNERIKEFENEKEKLQAIVINHKKNIDDDLENLSKLKSERLYKNNMINNIRLEIDNNKLDLMNLEKLNSKYAMDKEKVEFNIKSIEDKISIEYHIDSSDIKKKIDYKNQKELRDNINYLKNEINKLGQINLSSIEEYEVVKERLDFNLNQKEDLLSSREEIKSILKELNKEMKQKFKDSFKRIEKYFDEIFKILFNGGKAVIEIEGEDELIGGIEIKAQPPGKRFQSLSLLSGGERALTAVALLFALLKVRPAPFCILDEIDAALDDANIKRYIDYLNELKDIQFIMITHRKITMEIANVLYGVTMEEKGVSNIISVELKH